MGNERGRKIALFCDNAGFFLDGSLRVRKRLAWEKEGGVKSMQF